MRTAFFVFLNITLFGALSPAYSEASVSPAGLWLFDDADAPGRATIGADLEVVGDFEWVDGPGGTRAVRVGPGSHFRCVHGIAPNGGGAKVNVYTMIMDLRSDLTKRFNALIQTDPENRLDDVLELLNKERTLGAGVIGYGPAHVIFANAWFRLALVVDNAAGLLDIYHNGERVIDGQGQPLDGRYALDTSFLALGDNDGGDYPIDLTLLAIFDRALSPEELRAFDVAHPRCPGGMAAPFGITVDGPDAAETGKRLRFGFRAEPAVAHPVQFRVDWGDGHVSAWDNFLPGDGEHRATHSYATAGAMALRTQIRDECGNASDWIPLPPLTVTGPDVVALLTPPYIQHVRPDGVTLLWEMTVRMNARVEVTTNAGDPAGVVAVEARPTGFSSFLYQAEVTGLSPGTSHAYRLTDDQGRLDASGTFQTAPAAFAPFSFAVWADSQGYNRGAYPDDPLEPTTSMMAHMARSGAALALTAGDLAEDGALYTDTRKFFLDRVVRQLGPAMPFYIAWGNHDSYRNAAIRRFAQQPSRDREGGEPGFGSFAFTHADCRFICIDYATMLPDIESWLPQELQSEASRSARHRFLFIHVPPYSELWIDGSQELRDRLVPLLEAHRVDICFSGHTHNYERGWKNGVHYVISGGGSWLDHGEPVVKDWPHVFIGGKNPVGDFPFGLVHHYMRIDVTDTGWTAHCVAFRPDGTEIGVIDSFSSADAGAPAP